MRSKIADRIWSKIKKTILLIVLVFFLCSCQTLIFAWYGIKKPEKAVSKKERIAYYEPFITNHEVDVKLYALSDTTEWFKTFQSFKGYSFPMIYLKNYDTDSLYSLNCFEDVKWEINLINDNNLDYTDLGDEENASHIKKIVANKSELLFNSKKTASHKTSKWSVQIVSATFLGKKLRKRMLPIFELKGLDLSLIHI